MELYGFNLEYENRYQKWVYKIRHRAYKLVDGIEGINGYGGAVDVTEVHEDILLTFEKYFSNYLKIAYVDLVNADKALLEVYRYGADDRLIIIHMVEYVHEDRVLYVTVYWDGESMSVNCFTDIDDIRDAYGLGDIPIF